jgi:hypothetical protein
VTVTGDLVVPQRGFAVMSPARILGEELFYNLKYQSFRVVVLDRMLDSLAGGLSAEADTPGSGHGGGPATAAPLLSRADHIRFLQTVAHGSDVDDVVGSLASFSDEFGPVVSLLEGGLAAENGCLAGTPSWMAISAIYKRFCGTVFIESQQCRLWLLM